MEYALTTNAEPRRNILLGLEDGLKGWRQAPEPRLWKLLAELTETSNDAEARSVVRGLSVVFGDGRALDEVRAIVLDETADPGLRRSALETLVQAGGEGLSEICLQVLPEARLNVVAAQGLAQDEDPAVAQALVAAYKKFRGPRRPSVIAILVSRPQFAHALLDAIERDEIPLRDLTAFDVRQIRSHGKEDLNDRVAALWGEVRRSPAGKQDRMDELKRTLTSELLAAADKSVGRALFNRTCAQCHRLFGEGQMIGPDLTGSNRNNIDYLLENIVDPSAVVNKNYGMSIVQLTDGRVLNGLVVRNSPEILELQTQTELLTIPSEAIEAVETTSLSPMPDGLLDNLSHKQIAALFAYLMHPSQVTLADEK